MNNNENVKNDQVEKKTSSPAIEKVNSTDKSKENKVSTVLQLPPLNTSPGDYDFTKAWNTREAQQNTRDPSNKMYGHFHGNCKYCLKITGRGGYVDKNPKERFYLCEECLKKQKVNGTLVGDPTFGGGHKRNKITKRRNASKSKKKGTKGMKGGKKRKKRKSRKKKKKRKTKKRKRKTRKRHR
jgi:hypothetical protein|tara:strand:+ start:49 stop:597 length:549 start_codon:yes stop_codon:yes gene_type:complete